MLEDAEKICAMPWLKNLDSVHPNIRKAGSLKETVDCYMYAFKLDHSTIYKHHHLGGERKEYP